MGLEDCWRVVRTNVILALNALVHCGGCRCLDFGHERSRGVFVGGLGVEFMS